METKTLSRIELQIKNRDFDDALKDLIKLNECFSEIVGLLYKTQLVPPYKWYEYYENMGIKFRLNVDSIIQLYTFPPDLPKGVIYHDLGSIYLLNRSLLETYLTFYYCYILPKSDEEGLVNYYIFHISGLVQRQNYGKHFRGVDSEKHTQQMTQEKRSIIDFQDKLNNLTFFQALPKQVQRNLLDGKFAKRFGFTDLIEMSDLKNVLFYDMWKLYSNYAHCELIGLLQINSYAGDPGSINGALYGTLTNTMIVVSVMIRDYIKIFKDKPAENIDIPEMDEEAIVLMEFWYRMGTEKSPN